MPSKCTLTLLRMHCCQESGEAYGSIRRYARLGAGLYDSERYPMQSDVELYGSSENISKGFGRSVVS